MESPQTSSGNRTTGGTESAVALKVENQATAGVPKYRTLIVLSFALWVPAIAAGLLYGFWYEITPAETDVVSDRWPAESDCVLSVDHPTLLMFVHPRCPCSRSSLNELAKLMTHCQGRVAAQVLFFKPRSSPESWARTDLWEIAARIPGVVPRLDLDGMEHRRFGARVSGEVLLFSKSGDLSFHGGITAGRGHEGDNQGRAALEALLLHGHSATTTTPVFGCELESACRCQQQRPPSGEMRQHHELSSESLYGLGDANRGESPCP